MWLSAIGGHLGVWVHTADQEQPRGPISATLVAECFASNSLCPSSQFWPTVVPNWAPMPWHLHLQSHNSDNRADMQGCLGNQCISLPFAPLAPSPIGHAFAHPASLADGPVFNDAQRLPAEGDCAQMAISNFAAVAPANMPPC